MDMTKTSFLLLLFASLEILANMSKNFLSIAVQIYNCTNNKVEIFEDALVPVTCGGILSTRDVRWRRGDEVIIGECRADGTSCTNNLYKDYSLGRSPQSTESRLTLLPGYRRHAVGTVSCAEIDSVSTASCTLVIRRHPVLGECDVTTDTVSVSGSCRVQGAYSSDNDYSCRWTVNNQCKQLPYAPCLAPSHLDPRRPTASTLASLTSASAPDIPLDNRWIIVGVVIAVTFIAIIIAAICVVINRRNLKCLACTEEKATPIKSDDFQDHVNVVYAPSDVQRQQHKETEEHYYSTADVLPGKSRPVAGEK